MHFRIHGEVLARFPSVCVGLVVARNVNNAAPAAAIDDVMRIAEGELRKRYAAHGLKNESTLAPWHAAFNELGISGSRFKTSVEALASRVLKGSKLPVLSPAVDLANAVSLRYLLPVGAHDMARLRGDISVGPARKGAIFTQIGQSIVAEVEEGEIVYADEAEVLTRRWVWRQSERTRVTGRTTQILFPIDGWVGISDVALRAAQGDLVRHLEQNLGAETRVYYLDRDHPNAQIWLDDVPPDTAVASDAGFRMSGTGYRESPARHSEAAATYELDAPLPSSQARSGGPRHWGNLDEVDALLRRAIVDVVVREELEARLRHGDKLRVKFGVDPTSPNLHIGHAVVLRKLHAFQRLGHTICLVIGDFTAQIGDASDKSSMRQMLSEEEVYQNLTTYKKQISTILDEKLVEWSFNADWLGPLRFKDVIGLASNFTVAQLLERENFTNRFTAHQPIGLQEFLYPLMQGYDSVALKADVELGGTEQLFNLLAGRTLQRAFGQRPQAVMTCALLLGLDGRKMSKSYGNAIALTEPAREMFAKVMRFADDQIISCFELCTDVALAELDAISDDIARGANPMVHKKRLALEVTSLYHSAARSREAQEAFEREIQRKERPSDIPGATLDKGGAWVLADLLVATSLTPSKSEARRKIAEGAVFVDDKRCTDPQEKIAVTNGMVIKLGRNYRRVVAPT